MSSEDNSNQMNSGNAFDGDSLGPSSPVGEQSFEVSWMNFSQNSSASQGHKVIEEGESGNGGVKLLKARALELC